MGRDGDSATPAGGRSNRLKRLPLSRYNFYKYLFLRRHLHPSVRPRPQTPLSIRSGRGPLEDQFKKHLLGILRFNSHLSIHMENILDQELDLSK